MGLFDFLFRRDSSKLGVVELARRLGTPEEALRAVRVEYHTFSVPKRGRNGGERVIMAPSAALKTIQRQILRRLLAKLRVHEAATGFETGHSIVTNALPHVRQHVVVRLDLKEFFTSTKATRVEKYFRKIGWNREAAGLLTHLTTMGGSLPQGAPTSPRLSNLLNVRLDTRLARLAASLGAAYSRYADDMTFSRTPRAGSGDDARTINTLIHAVKEIVRDEGYDLHQDRKLRITRRHDRQLVTGLVVNDRVRLPRRTRRWLRAVEHHVADGRPATLTPQQLQGWRSLRSMVDTYGAAPH